MGGVVSKAANGIGGVIGSAFAAPIKSIFGASCETLACGPSESFTWKHLEIGCVSETVCGYGVIATELGCLFGTMGCSMFHKTFMCLQSGETVNDLGPLLHNVIVLLLIVQVGNLPMHRKKPL